MLEVKHLAGGLLWVVAGGFGHEEEAWEMFYVRTDEKSFSNPGGAVLGLTGVGEPSFHPSAPLLCAQGGMASG